VAVAKRRRLALVAFRADRAGRRGFVTARTVRLELFVGLRFRRILAS
jgi:hypothetical protein